MHEDTSSNLAAAGPEFFAKNLHHHVDCDFVLAERPLFFERAVASGNGRY